MKKNSNERGYGYRWQKARDLYLKAHPLCVFCEKEGRVNAANVVDHIIPHKGDKDLFWDSNNWQSLCSGHHASTKQRQELGQKVEQIGLDGWPVE